MIESRNSLYWNNLTSDFQVRLSWSRDQPSTVSLPLVTVVGGALALRWQHDLEARAAGRRTTYRHSPVVEHDDLLNERETEAGPAALRREEGPEDTLAKRGRDAGPVVVDGDARHLLLQIDIGLNNDARRRRGADAGFERIAQQI